MARLLGWLGLDLEATCEVGEHAVGLALDLSKCYDPLPLALLREVAERAGILRAIFGPMLQRYGMQRRVRADWLAGAAIRPLRGLAPGCPAATHWLVALCWARDVVALGAALREYVNDLVALCRGP